MKKPKRILVGLKTLENTVELAALTCRLSSRGASLVLVHVIHLIPRSRGDFHSGLTTARYLMPQRAKIPRRESLFPLSLQNEYRV